MSNLIPFPAVAPNVDVASSTPEAPATRADEFWTECVRRYGNYATSRNVGQPYQASTRRLVSDLIRHSRKDLAQLLESDYEAWSAHLLADRKLARSTRRTYQKHIRSFADYICSDAELQALAIKLYGVKVALFAHRYNSILHVGKEERGKKLRPMTHEEVDAFFDAMERRIEDAECYSPREVRALYRDKAVYFLMYVNGMRIEELENVDRSDWRPLKELPELERYGQVKATGKGAKGSGPRHRMIPTSDPNLALVMCHRRRKTDPPAPM